MFVFRGVQNQEVSPAAATDGFRASRKTNAIRAFTPARESHDASPFWQIHLLQERLIARITLDILEQGIAFNGI
jgi:hypothetical protein